MRLTCASPASWSSELYMLLVAKQSAFPCVWTEIGVTLEKMPVTPRIGLDSEDLEATRGSRGCAREKGLS